MATLAPKVLESHGGLRLQSGPGPRPRFEVTGEETGGVFGSSVVEVASHGGPSSFGSVVLLSDEKKTEWLTAAGDLGADENR